MEFILSFAEGLSMTSAHFRGSRHSLIRGEGAANYARPGAILMRRDSAAVAPLLRSVVRFADGPLDAELAHTGT